MKLVWAVAAVIVGVGMRTWYNIMTRPRHPPPRVVSIDGGIGAGKSTLVRALARDGYVVFEERVHAAFLRALLDDKSVAMATQAMIMGDECGTKVLANVLCRQPQQRTHVFTDRSMMGVLAFSLVMHGNGDMRDSAMGLLLDEWQRRFDEVTSDSDVHVFLDVSAKRCVQSVAYRGNDYECVLPMRYHEQLRVAHLVTILWLAACQETNRATKYRLCVIPYDDFGRREAERLDVAAVGVDIILRAIDEVVATERVRYKTPQMVDNVQLLPDLYNRMAQLPVEVIDRLFTLFYRTSLPSSGIVTVDFPESSSFVHIQRQYAVNS